MSEQLHIRAARAAAVTTLTFAAVLGGVGPAGATSPEDHPIEVSLGAAGIQVPDGSHTGGLVSFRVATDDASGRQLQLLRPHDGVTPEKAMSDLAASVSADPATAAAGIKAFRTEADALGGALVTPQVHEQFTEEISPGAVYLVDLTALRADPAHPVTKRLDLVGTSGQSANQARFQDGMVIERDSFAGPRFQTEDLDHAHLAYLVHNESTEIHEMQLRPVAAGTTDAQLDAYYAALAAGGKPASPFTGPGTGFGGISPDHSAAIQAHGLQPGTYALLCLVPDETLGVPHAALGMRRIVTLQ
ncbi:hypothetical protein P3T37_000849 [Kitasatospora sp. MAA4]|uniref:hypothetical protein n=1 Tax=Kitasatospora sp. MAA4 TaxID=3035093 RepID=UPI00247409B0|nr:hypothetical protein [Kitasatospora sp. MAA4]MDH6131480.1 hypothetical protein [Kitasatospora sp. MAA4]